MKIVEAGSLSRAATTVFVAQPALSQQMAELEEELGVTLLHRSARGVRPTAAGEALYREALLILQRIEKLPEIVRFTGTEVAGSIRLGMSSTLAAFLAGPFMRACSTALPQVSISLVTENSAALAARVLAGTLDLALLFEHSSTPGLARKALLRQRFYLIERKRQGRKPSSITLARAAALPLVLPSPQNAMRTLIDSHFAAAGVAPRVVAQADLLSSLASAVQSGVGATILPLGDLSAAPGFDRLVATPIEPPIRVTGHVVWSEASAFGRVGEVVRDALVSFIGRFLEEHTPAGMEPLEGHGPA